MGTKRPRENSRLHEGIDRDFVDAKRNRSQSDTVMNDADSSQPSAKATKIVPHSNGVHVDKSQQPLEANSVEQIEENGSEEGEVEE